MAVKSKTALTTDIDNQITTNGNNEITGADLNVILGDMVDSYENVVVSYTTVQIAALVGMTLRQRVFNTDDNDYEWYDGTRWVKEAHPKYKVYKALLTQTGTDAPVPVVLENTLGGTVVWTRNAVGEYFGTLASAFTDDKTALFVSIGSGTTIVSIFRNSVNVLHLHTYAQDAGTQLFEADDGLLISTSIEIQVYY